jgi:hypothetical protein
VSTALDATTKQYKPLEKRIRKGDLDALLARWQFGRKLLAVRGSAKQLPHGFAATLHAKLDTGVQLAAYQRELSRRMMFAEQYPSEKMVRAALKEYGSWSAICAQGLMSREVADTLFKPDVSVSRPPRYSPRTQFERQYYAVLDRIRGCLRPHTMAYQALWLTALQHGIEQEIGALERRQRAAVEPDRGLLKFVI